jgi:hypothetical protein
MMIATHDAFFSDRMCNHLIQRGFSVTRSAETFIASLSAAQASESFLSHLFSFPYLDFAFFRYPAEILEFDGNEKLKAFGSCTSGILTLRDTGEVAIFDEEEGLSVIAKSIERFCVMFHLLVHASTSPFEEVPRSKELLERNLDELSQEPFWAQVLNSLVEGDAAPRYHLLTALIDGAVEKLV